jgi:hypothetical protein
MPSLSLLSQRLFLEIQGLSTHELSDDLISFRFVETGTGSGEIEVQLVNLGDTPTGFKYSEGSALQIGRQVKVGFGDTELASGTIRMLAPQWNALTPPTLIFKASTQGVLLAPAVMVQLQWGSNLIEFHPVMNANTQGSAQPIVATGFANAIPTLRAGSICDVAGVGTSWSGRYTVTETTHSFDPQQGYRVAFSCCR